MINRDKNGRFNTTNWWMKYFKRVSCAKKTGFKWRLKFLLLFHMCAMSYLLFTSKFLVDFATLLYVCVRACVRACVCMCACLGFFRLQDVRDILEGTNQRSCVVNINLPRFFILASEMSYFTSKDENSSHHKLDRKRYDILTTSEKMLYIDTGYKSAST